MTESDYLHEEIRDLQALRETDQRHIDALQREIEAKDKLIKLQEQMIQMLEERMYR